MRYLVRCADCDRAFWLDTRDAPAPEHSPWDRRLSMEKHEPAGRCMGSNRPGYWIGEGEGSLVGWPRS